jgi:TldD protein
MIPSESVQYVLAAALKNGADLAELYLEDSDGLTLTLDDGRLEKAVQGNDTGGGVRVFYGNTAAYAYTDDLSEKALIEAAQTAAAAAKGTSQLQVSIDMTRTESALDFPVEKPFDELSVTDKAAILRRMDAEARAYSPSVVQVTAQYNQVGRRVWIFNSEGLWVEDDRPVQPGRAAGLDLQLRRPVG